MDKKITFVADECLRARINVLGQFLHADNVGALIRRLINEAYDKHEATIIERGYLLATPPKEGSK